MPDYNPVAGSEADTSTRASEGYFRTIGWGDAGLRAFDYDRIRNLPPLDGVGEHSREQAWERFTRFLKAVVPVVKGGRVTGVPSQRSTRPCARASRPRGERIRRKRLQSAQRRCSLVCAL